MNVSSEFLTLTLPNYKSLVTEHDFQIKYVFIIYHGADPNRNCILNFQWGVNSGLLVNDGKGIEVEHSVVFWIFLTVFRNDNDCFISSIVQWISTWKLQKKISERKKDFYSNEPCYLPCLFRTTDQAGRFFNLSLKNSKECVRHNLQLLNLEISQSRIN